MVKGGMQENMNRNGGREEERETVCRLVGIPFFLFSLF